MLLNNTCLVNLYLDHNAINGKGLVLLAEGLARNTTLQFLTLWGNEWSTEACDAFARLVGGSVSNCCIGSTDSKPIPGQKQLLEKIGSAFGNRVGIFRAVQPRARANNRVGALTLGSTESRGTSAVSSLSSRSNAGSRAAQPETAKGEDVEQPADTRPPRFKDGQIDVVFYGIEGVTFAAHYPIPDVV
ncbi:uncharacterized protein BJ171DRAFT_528216 [Polychytrium aggregatum]|uniref:uncharacterized protein n=1 Tax=Polychytrium aggregatum TaxID=110093 RepID=UPI0022FE2B28|nr:uncharacterized protein BJ171DRAFT_528216 [Polychytrium aggregatum]KAI9193399.1 hypothetical protein BJ171DRAFT_528216 [Polychytrium aggregatum]